MDDLISRQAAIDALKQQAETMSEWSNRYAEQKKGVLTAVNIVEDLPTTQRWIPCSERLPEKDGLYIVSVINDRNRRYSKTCWYHGHEKWFARQDVVAWMPLPEPYREDGDNDDAID